MNMLYAYLASVVYFCLQHFDISTHVSGIEQDLTTNLLIKRQKKQTNKQKNVWNGFSFCCFIFGWNNLFGISCVPKCGRKSIFDFKGSQLGAFCP